ncbi:alpha/beta hydrolase [Agreia sp. VKM Ac-1783]|uniref:alpha/beta hydrolase n=1 Tax=Agreia sp. VKM Ac-1783 TaxID=1938889 RepID=UPI0020168B74|nr:alpha/beta hydrolase [Agreia sp. VKM Ac-1783]
MSLPEKAADAYLADHPDLVIKVLDLRPDVVAEWWDGYPREKQAQMIDSAPQVVGNLQGVDYTSRDTANRQYLAERIGAASRLVAENPGDTDAGLELAALTAIRGALRGHPTPSRYLISLTDDEPPLASIAVGDLDAAEQATFVVPGMGTYTSDMQLWTNAAENVYKAQGRAGAPGHRSVIAWIGYQTPPPGIEATLGGFAARGAPRFASDVKALTATRQGTGLDTIDVIAHSYGSTMVADALFGDDLGVSVFVMLGSAGVEKRIGTSANLKVDRVYAGEAVQDEEAGLGRIERVDPRSPIFGATVIDVDGNSLAGLLGVTEHAPILHSAYNDDPTSAAWTKYPDPAERIRLYSEHMTDFGYLDNGTQSLWNTAQATTQPSESRVEPSDGGVRVQCDFTTGPELGAILLESSPATSIRTDPCPPSRT